MDINNNTNNILLPHLAWHLVGVSSTCSNPLLYGLLNYNIWKEDSLLLAQLRKLPNIFKSRAPRQEEVELATLATEIRSIMSTSLLQSGALLLRGLKVVFRYSEIFSVTENILPELRPRQSHLQPAHRQARDQVRLHGWVCHQGGVT